MDEGFWDYKPLDRWSAHVEPNRCRSAVYDRGSVRSHQCTRKPVKNGYCRVHFLKFGARHAATPGASPDGE